MNDDPAELGPVPPAIAAAYAPDRFHDDGHARMRPDELHHVEPMSGA